MERDFTWSPVVDIKKLQPYLPRFLPFRAWTRSPLLPTRSMSPYSGFSTQQGDIAVAACYTCLRNFVTQFRNVASSFWCEPPTLGQSVADPAVAPTWDHVRPLQVPCYAYRCKFIILMPKDKLRSLRNPFKGLKRLYLHITIPILVDLLVLHHHFLKRGTHVHTRTSTFERHSTAPRMACIYVSVLACVQQFLVS